MNNSIQKERKDPVITLKAQAEKFDFSKLRAGKDNVGANSGAAMHLDFPRMKFIINKKDIDQDFIKQLYEKHDGLIENYGNGKKNYRQFAKEAFKEMFTYAEAQVPSDPILEELVTNCNQAGYVGAFAAHAGLEFGEHGLSLGDPVKVVSIHCTNINYITVQPHMVTPVEKLGNIGGNTGKKICDLLNSIEFTLKSQGDKNVTYEDGKLLLAVPKRLEDYNIGDKSLFDIIKEYFYKFCEKLGFKFDAEIEHDLGSPIEVNSHLESVQQPIHSNEHGNTL